MMKICILVVCVLGYSYAMFGKTKEEMESIKKECEAKSGVDPTLIEKVMNGTAQPDDKMTTHFICCAQKVGLIDAKGKINTDLWKTEFHDKFKDDTTEKQFITECLVDKSSLQETAAAFLNCSMKFKFNHQ